MGLTGQLFGQLCLASSDLNFSDISLAIDINEMKGLFVNLSLKSKSGDVNHSTDTVL